MNLNDEVIVVHDRPSFYLGSREHRGEWQKPRAAHVLRVVPDKRGTKHLWLRIDPPVVPEDGRGEMREVVIGPHFEGDVVWPQPKLPTAVYVYLPKAPSGSETTFDQTEFDLVAWAEIYASQADAANASP
jgi:hypothetical protein